jgi:hypothetical protein
MTARKKNSWRWLAIAFLTATLAGGRDARAGGIMVKIGQQPGGGDPPYDYIMQVYLDPGYGVDYANWFTIESLKGVTTGSFTMEPVNIPDGISWSPSINEKVTAYPYASDVTWYFTGTNPYKNTGTGEIYLGEFGVETTVNFSSPPYIDGTIIDYHWSIVDLNGKPSTGSGQTPIVTLGIPEPTSSLLLLTGTAILPFVALRQHRRRQSVHYQPQ